MTTRMARPAVFALFLALLWLSTVSCPGASNADTAVRPLRALLLYDQTASRSESRIDPLTSDHVRQVAELVMARGGEVAFGCIDESSNDPLIRLFVGTPPQAPRSPGRTGNPFEDKKRLHHNQELEATYRAARAEWEAGVNRRLQFFLVRVEARLQREVLAPSTDVLGAVKRARIYFGEPHPELSEPDDVFLLFTDGVETRSSGTVKPFSQPVRIAVVNGEGSVGVLTPLNPVPFEGIDASLRWIELSR